MPDSINKNISIDSVAYALDVKRQTALKYTQRPENPLPADKRPGHKGGTFVDLRGFVLWVRNEALSGSHIDEDGKVIDYQAERARLTKNQADHEALKVQVLEGDLLPADEVAELWSKKLLEIRAAVMSLPIKIAQAAIEHDDFRKAEMAGRHVVNDFLNELVESLTEEIDEEAINEPTCNKRA